MGWRIGVDIGGTFTDEASGRVGIAKVSTTPHDFGAAVIDQFPYKIPTGNVYDSGDYDAVRAAFRQDSARRFAYHAAKAAAPRSRSDQRPARAKGESIPSLLVLQHRDVFSERRVHARVVALRLRQSVHGSRPTGRNLECSSSMSMERPAPLSPNGLDGPNATAGDRPVTLAIATG